MRQIKDMPYIIGVSYRKRLLVLECHSPCILKYEVIILQFCSQKTHAAYGLCSQNKKMRKPQCLRTFSPFKTPYFPKLPAGFEPATYALRMRCSTS